ncbi:MAG: uroporphyrinogen-III synthase [Pseudomonadota bacterium]
MSSVLLTRVEQDNKALAQELKQKGYEVFEHPFLVIEPLDYELPEPQNFSALLFTSSKAVDYLKDSEELVHLPVFCVGSVTGDKVREKGLNIQKTYINVDELIQDLNQMSFDSPLLYLSGREIFKDLFQELHHAVHRVELYNSIQVIDINEEIFLNSQIDSVLFYSRRTAEAFAKALETSPYSNEIKESITRTSLLCLSDSMLNYLAYFPWKDVHVAEKPTHQDMIKKLEEIKNKG